MSRASGARTWIVLGVVLGALMAMLGAVVAHSRLSPSRPAPSRPAAVNLIIEASSPAGNPTFNASPLPFVTSSPNPRCWIRIYAFAFPPDAMKHGHVSFQLDQLSYDILDWRESTEHMAGDHESPFRQRLTFVDLTEGDVEVRGPVTVRVVTVWDAPRREDKRVYLRIEFDESKIACPAP